MSASAHHWYTPADCAAVLHGHKYQHDYRARCPAHGGDNPQSLSIREGTDRDGHPMTLLYCFAQQCPIEAICAAMGISVRNLFCIHPDYAHTTRHAPRAHSPRIDRLRTMPEPTPDDIAQLLLEEMIVSDPAWIQACRPARQKLWALAQASPKRKEAFTKALRQARINATPFWHILAHDMEG